MPHIPLGSDRASARRRSSLVTRLRVVGAMATVMGLSLLAVPLGAQAADPMTSHPVTFAVRIDDGSDAVGLAGVQLSVRSPYAEAPTLATGVTGADGTVSLDVPGEPGAHVVDAVWPGADGDLDVPEATT